ncbi:MAG: hypothetical protein RLN60_05635 [Phycisphaerales bacterium]
MELDFGLITTIIISALGVMYVLYIAASVTREEMAIHDLCVRSHRLRNDYAHKLARLRGEFEEEVVGVDIVAPEGGDDAETLVGVEIVPEAA